MKFPQYKAGPVEHWLAQAFTEFVNGFIAGLGGGTFSGVGAGTVTATTGLGTGFQWFQHVFVAVGAMGLNAAGNGFKRVIVWHNDNPFPNPWPVRVAPSTPPTPIV